MNLRLKVIIGTVLLSGIMSATFFYANSNPNNTSVINVGSKSPSVEMSSNWEQFKNAKHMIDFGCDMVIEATVLDDGKTIEEDAPTTFPGEEPIKLHRTLYEVSVDNVLNGECPDSKIIFEQMGSSGSDVGETKVKKGERVILFLEKNRYGYSAMGQEQGIYIIGSDEKINSLTDNNDLINKYNKKQYKEFAKEIKEVQKAKKSK